MNFKKSISIAFIAVLMTATFAQAIPSLQLDIQGGIYDPISQAIVASSDPFTLYAYLIPDNNPNGPNALLADTYYISAAVVPQVGPAGQNLGSFSFNGIPINVTTDLVYGNPPIETSQLHDPGDLPPHGIYNTYFAQSAFNFDPANKALAYNVSDTPGAGPTADPNGTMYFQSFAIDTRALNSGSFIHFDLYNTLNGLSFQGVLNGGDVDINSFAPFSQTAESPHSVPEPASLLLLGLGLIGITGIRRKFRN